MIPVSFSEIARDLCQYSTLKFKYDTLKSKLNTLKLQM